MREPRDPAVEGTTSWWLYTRARGNGKEKTEYCRQRKQSMRYTRRVWSHEAAAIGGGVQDRHSGHDPNIYTPPAARAPGVSLTEAQGFTPTPITSSGPTLVSRGRMSSQAWTHNPDCKQVAAYTVAARSLLKDSMTSRKEAFRLAPPTRKPSTSGSWASSLQLPGLTLPPYRMRVSSATFSLTSPAR